MDTCSGGMDVFDIFAFVRSREAQTSGPAHAPVRRASTESQLHVWLGSKLQSARKTSDQSAHVDSMVFSRSSMSAGSASAPRSGASSRPSLARMRPRYAAWNHSSYLSSTGPDAAGGSSGARASANFPQFHLQTSGCLP